MGVEPRGNRIMPKFNEKFYARKAQENVVPEGYQPGDIARNIGGEGTPMIDADAMTENLRHDLQSKGALDFAMGTGDAAENVTALLHFNNKGKGQVELIGAVGHNFNRPEGKGVVFATDLHDAPEELRAAVLAKWQAIQTNERIFVGDNALPPAIKAEQDIEKSRIAPMIAAMEASQKSQEVVPGATAEAAKPTKVEATPNVNKVEQLAKMFRVEIPAEVANVLNKDGSIVLVDGRELPPKVAAVRLEPVVRGVNIHGWQVAEVAGETSVVVGYRYKANMADMPGFMRKGINDTQRALGTSDKLLQQAFTMQEKTPRAQRRSAAAEAAQPADQTSAYRPVEITDFPDDLGDLDWQKQKPDRRTAAGKFRAAMDDESIR